jgi:hypothetical protein
MEDAPMLALSLVKTGRNSWIIKKLGRGTSSVAAKITRKGGEYAISAIQARFSQAEWSGIPDFARCLREGVFA